MTALSMPPHVHDWRLVEEEQDDWGTVRRYECAVCGEVRYL